MRQTQRNTSSLDLGSMVRTSLTLITGSRAVPASLGGAPSPTVRAFPAPHVVSVHASDPTPMDWTADWIIHARMPWLAFDQARRMVACVLERQRRHKTLTPWEVEILVAWDETCSLWAVEMAEEGQ